MGLLDRFREGAAMQRKPDAHGALSGDDQAIERYRYMLRTAPPETIEQAHAEAFERLTPEQRQRVLRELREAAPAGERVGLARSSDSPGDLARLATRAEIREPGALERMFGNVRAGPGMSGAPSMGGLFGATLLGSVAGTVLGSMVAQHFFSAHPDALQRFGEWPNAGGNTGGHPDDSYQASDDHSADDTGAADSGDSGMDFGDTFDV